MPLVGQSATVTRSWAYMCPSYGRKLRYRSYFGRGFGFHWGQNEGMEELLAKIPERFMKMVDRAITRWLSKKRRGGG